jgi:hypothetical protein
MFGISFVAALGPQISGLTSTRHQLLFYHLDFFLTSLLLLLMPGDMKRS